MRSPVSRFVSLPSLSFLFLACALGGLLILCPCTSGAPISVDSWSLNARVDAGDASGAMSWVEVIDSTVSIPFNVTRAAVDGASTSQTTYDFTVDANSASLLFDFEHTRGGIYGGRAGEGDSLAESLGTLTFTANMPSTYSLSGAYSLSGSRYFYLRGRLVDTTAGVELFGNDQWSMYTADEAFVLGESGGDHFNALSGSMTGELVAGHTYELTYVADTQAYPSSDSGATAAGFFAMNAVAIPEPSTLAILLFLAGPIALTKLCMRRKRRIR